MYCETTDKICAPNKTTYYCRSSQPIAYKRANPSSSIWSHQSPANDRIIMTGVPAEAAAAATPLKRDVVINHWSNQICHRIADHSSGSEPHSRLDPLSACLLSFDSSWWPRRRGLCYHFCCCPPMLLLSHIVTRSPCLHFSSEEHTYSRFVYGIIAVIIWLICDILQNCYDFESGATEMRPESA